MKLVFWVWDAIDILNRYGFCVDTQHGFWSWATTIFMFWLLVEHKIVLCIMLVWLLPSCYGWKQIWFPCWHFLCGTSHLFKVTTCSYACLVDLSKCYDLFWDLFAREQCENKLVTACMLLVKVHPIIRYRQTDYIQIFYSQLKLWNVLVV